MRFRPCIDLHDGQVKQIVGGTLSDTARKSLATNFTSRQPSSYYARLYQSDNLTGGHVIMLGPGNEQAAREALAAWPGGLQVGGGINIDNATLWLDRGASHVIVTSHVFHDGLLDFTRLKALVAKIGRNRLVLDLSCRWRENGYYVVTDRWQQFTELSISSQTLEMLSAYCAEYLIHAVDVEGKSMGIDEKLLGLLAQGSPVPMTYAGGVSSMADINKIRTAGMEQIDYTVGSALDIFGGSGLRYQQLAQLHNE
ncbi:phosphoribosylformimino-5-aminoimidazole carboxamide ribotide isomerase [Desulfogranum japonicum]|uniref:phosphoribosylformimino-5-aminoimidazole carboxamide ribotide isomerase n=1 Tax=Desulfogranum japonicum TaxID=231447 RepID=UPI00040BC75E|nr:phosphoribosylformimino-5-aminoimidazole carboxamide ribotide isomerase [Desulfogranum japonicum]